MKTLIPSALLAFMKSKNTFGLANLFQIALTNGQVLRTTDCQVNLTYGGNTYYASQYGAWERGVVKMKASFSLEADDVSLTAKVPGDYQVYFPGTTIPLMQCLSAGLFDGANITIYTAYWPEGAPPNTSLGVETKFVGVILNFEKLGRSVVEFKVGDLLWLLNLKTPPKTIQAGCRHVFCDPNCTMIASSFTSAPNSVASGSTTNTINLASAVTASIYALGVVTFTSGQNNGLKMTIKAQPSTTQIVLAGTTPLPLGIGDTFTMLQGCNKTQARCEQIQGSNFFLNYGGQPYVPFPELAL